MIDETRSPTVSIPTDCYIAYGFQGDTFSVHLTKEGAVRHLREEVAPAYGLDPAEITDEVIDGDGGDLDGFNVERERLLP